MLHGLLILIVSTFLIEASARRSAPIDLQPALREELNSLLGATADLHEASFSQDDSRWESSLKNVLNHIDSAQKKSALAKAERPHLLKILRAARSELEISQMQTGEDRRASLQNGFRQLVQVAQVFKLNKYRIFFCPKDKSVWLQRAAVAKNPINPQKFGDCGKLVQ